MVFITEKISCRCYYHWRLLCWKIQTSPIDITVDTVDFIFRDLSNSDIIGFKGSMGTSYSVVKFAATS